MKGGRIYTRTTNTYGRVSNPAGWALNSGFWKRATWWRGGCDDRIVQLISVRCTSCHVERSNYPRPIDKVEYTFTTDVQLAYDVARLPDATYKLSIAPEVYNTMAASFYKTRRHNRPGFKGYRINNLLWFVATKINTYKCF